MKHALLCLMAGVIATAQPGARSCVVTAEFIADAPPTPQCHASTIVETTDGMLVAAWFGGTGEGQPGVDIWVSRHQGRTWSAPVAVTASALAAASPHEPTWNPVLVQSSRGPLMLFYKIGASPAAWRGMLMTSADGGRTWAPPQPLPPGILGPIKNKPIEMPGGALLCPSSSEDGGWTVHFERTGDLGRTWSRTPALNDPRNVSAIQPSVLVHPDGRLQAIGRTQQDRLFSIESGDGGRTWNAMTLLDLPNPNAGIDAVTLRDGRHVLVYNHAHGKAGRWDVGRGVLNVAVSGDGRSWNAVAVLEREAGQEFSYPAVIQTRDGLVHITYTWKRQRIRHVVLDPARFDPHPIVNGEWPVEGR